MNEMRNDLVSIIVPVYKVEKYLSECVDSIIAQTYKDIEIILVDDGSPDKSGEICDDYAAKDDRIHVIHKTNGGLSSARNAGLKQAKGEFVTFCDSDDLIDSRAIETACKLFNIYDCDIVSYESILFNENKEERIPNYHKNHEVTRLSPINCLGGMLDYTYDCSCCNKVFRRSVLGLNRFKEGITNEDVLFYFDVLPSCKKDVIHINKEYYKYRLNTDGITHTFNASSLNAFYNAIQIHKKVTINLPVLKELSYIYLINNAYHLGRRICSDNKRKEEPFQQALLDIKKQIFRALPFILFHRNKFVVSFFPLKCMYLMFL